MGKGYVVEGLTEEEIGNIVAGGELDPDDFVAIRLPPAGGMQMQVHPQGGHVLIQPVVLPKGTMTWQRATGLAGPDGQPLMTIEPGDIIMGEFRLVVKKATVCETAPEEPPLPRLVPPPQEA